MRIWNKLRSAVVLLAAALLTLVLAQSVLRPATIQNVRYESITMDGPFEVVQQVLELAPGAESPVHMHGGPELILVIEGEVVFLLEEGGETTTVRAGEIYMIPAETFLQVSNESDSDASFVVTFLLPEGATLTTPR
ncbi:MAG: cupin domain-containing protein [Trueperaceae bacterium]